MSEDDGITLDLTEKPDYTWSDEDADAPERPSEEELEERRERYEEMKEGDDD